MKIVAIVTQKGGSGKTTVTVSLAVEAERQGLTAVVIDLDPQVNATLWSDRRRASQQLESPVVVSAVAARLPQVLEAAEQNGTDIVFIDTPGKASDVALAALRAAGLTLIVSQASAFDLSTMDVNRDLLKLSASTAPAYVVLNCMPPPPAYKKRQQAEDYIRGKGLDVCPAALSDRTAYQDSATLGLAAQEYDPNDNAAAEIAALYGFMCKHLNSQESKGVKNHGKESRRFAGHAAG